MSGLELRMAAPALCVPIGRELMSGLELRVAAQPV